MDKSSWLLLTELERVNLMSQWLDELRLLGDVPPSEKLEIKRQLEKKIFNVLEWMKDYE